MGTELYHADEQTDRHDEASSRRVQCPVKRKSKRGQALKARCVVSDLKNTLYRLFYSSRYNAFGLLKLTCYCRDQTACRRQWAAISRRLDNSTNFETIAMKDTLSDHEKKSTLV